MPYSGLNPNPSRPSNTILYTPFTLKVKNRGRTVVGVRGWAYDFLLAHL